jgi:hypothetical protein
MAERLPEYLPPIHQLCGRGFFLLLITCMAINNLDQLLEEKGDLATVGCQLDISDGYWMCVSTARRNAGG